MEFCSRYGLQWDVEKLYRGCQPSNSRLVHFDISSKLCDLRVCLKNPLVRLVQVEVQCLSKNQCYVDKELLFLEFGFQVRDFSEETTHHFLFSFQLDVSLSELFPFVLDSLESCVETCQLLEDWVVLEVVPGVQGFLILLLCYFSSQDKSGRVLQHSQESCELFLWDDHLGWFSKQ